MKVLSQFLFLIVVFSTEEKRLHKISSRAPGRSKYIKKILRISWFLLKEILFCFLAFSGSISSSVIYSANIHDSVQSSTLTLKIAPMSWSWVKYCPLHCFCSSRQGLHFMIRDVARLGVDFGGGWFNHQSRPTPTPSPNSFYFSNWQESQPRLKSWNVFTIFSL